MQACLLSGARDQAAVGLSLAADTEGPVLVPEQARAIVGPGPRIYFVRGRFLLDRLRDALGPLALPRGAVRVWWPGLVVGGDPGEHPVVTSVDGESRASMGVEFAHQFDLSRPHVRQEIRLIEDVHAVAEHELAQARERNRDLEIERDEALARAEAAEARMERR